jgi:hypothetical protein
VDLLRGGQLVLVFPVAGAVQETLGAVARLHKESEAAADRVPDPRAAKHVKHH